MNEFQRTGFTERLKTASDAKKALLAAFRPRPAVAATDFQPTAARRKAELEQVRRDRADAKTARLQAAEDAILARRLQAEAEAAASLDAKRGERKERKALTKAEQKAKRDARYAARKARA
ncbi:DUF6481 family protein [Phenylobacterium sp. SCN 70-31]|uniref:DUF6481 family protein n=1 Tax=Phenylobacterium sp. SCN 70-31 TaxID=1660129 RepID=UPI00086DE051|nr:DUF6481 family protein [Phenylobacterium sp. SCN 70-31]ODT87273.1 MAG: hypothetical protein ABS78_12730 [Phenylobacterium sp. SCN 70-31]